MMTAPELEAESLELFHLTRLTAHEEIIMNKRWENFKYYISETCSLQKLCLFRCERLRTLT